MKYFNGKIQYKDKEYKLTFNLNVMQRIQEEFGSLDKWGELTDGSVEPDAKAIIFGFTEMINEGIDIDNEENGTDNPPLTMKQVGRLMSEIGFENATLVMNDTVVNSTQSDEKNA